MIKNDSSRTHSLVNSTQSQGSWALWAVLSKKAGPLIQEPQDTIAHWPPGTQNSRMMIPVAETTGKITIALDAVGWSVKSASALDALMSPASILDTL